MRSTKHWIVALAVLLMLAVSGQAAAQTITIGPIAEPKGKDREQLHWIPVYVNGEQRKSVLQVRTCRPAGDAKAPLAIINHGSPPDAAKRATIEPNACDGVTAQWFLQRGYATAFPLRRGYGATGGDWAEAYGSCSRPNFVGGGLGTADDIDAALRYMREQAYVNPARILIIGQSAGGWGTVALASRKPEGVWGLVNFAGGRGGWAEKKPNTNCSPPALIEAAGKLGSTARQPMLWVYTENDSYFAPELSKGMHAAFTKAGGNAEYVLLPAFRSDGHGLFGNREGPRVWGPVLEKYIASLPQ